MSDFHIATIAKRHHSVQCHQKLAKLYAHDEDSVPQSCYRGWCRRGTRRQQSRDRKLAESDETSRFEHQESRAAGGRLSTLIVYQKNDLPDYRTFNSSLDFLPPQLGIPQ